MNPALVIICRKSFFYSCFCRCFKKISYLCNLETNYFLYETCF